MSDTAEPNRIELSDKSENQETPDMAEAQGTTESATQDKKGGATADGESGDKGISASWKTDLASTSLTLLAHRSLVWQA